MAKPRQWCYKGWLSKIATSVDGGMMMPLKLAVKVAKRGQMDLAHATCSIWKA